MSTPASSNILIEETNEPNREVQKYSLQSPQESPHVRLACLLLNYLEENLSPTIPDSTEFFNGPTFPIKVIHKISIPSNSTRCVAVGLNTVTDLAKVQIKIQISKSLDPQVQGKMDYRLRALTNKDIMLRICHSYQVWILSWKLSYLLHEAKLMGTVEILMSVVMNLRGMMS
jgi:hypothetical protein